MASGIGCIPANGMNYGGNLSAEFGAFMRERFPQSRIRGTVAEQISLRDSVMAIRAAEMALLPKAAPLNATITDTDAYGYGNNRYQGD